jgi:cytochrome c553
MVWLPDFIRTAAQLFPKALLMVAASTSAHSHSSSNIKCFLACAECHGFERHQQQWTQQPKCLSTNRFIDGRMVGFGLALMLMTTARQASIE